MGLRREKGVISEESFPIWRFRGVFWSLNREFIISSKFSQSAVKVRVLIRVDQ